ncbi:MAG TPA: 30S ribosomal protein S18 [Acidobacteriota bacterium]|nr:30S ribosomal protein S18 [Acidobacteriota bacterium]
MRSFRPRRKKVSKLTKSNVDYVDYKDVELLRQYIDPRGKIIPRRTNGNSARHQRMLSRAVKRARYMALLPYVSE